MKHRISGTFAALLLLFHTLSPVYSQSSGVTDARFSRLAKGVAFTWWFQLSEDDDEEPDVSDNHFLNYIPDEELQYVHGVGFTHVRLPIDPEVILLDWRDPGRLDPHRLALLKGAVERITAHDLAVILDIHDQWMVFGDDGISGADEQQAFADFWQQVASYFSDANPELVFFEVLNEPVPDEPSDWTPIQENAVRIIREAAPEHTIIVGGPDWNSIDGLTSLEPLDDTNVVYNFHFYEPFIFTHQGADWLETVVRLHDIPYPSTEGRCGELPAFGDEAADELARRYCTSDVWDAQRIEQRIREAAEWAARWNLRLTCNEFGAMQLVTPLDDRLQWFTDVRRALEEHDIGWNVWGFDNGFAFDFYPGWNTLPLDEGLLRALGLAYAPV
jgi:endoglucanase